MSRNNDVFNVLVATGDQALATTGGPGDLLAGQIGVFDADTNVAITAGAKPQNFYIAVGTADGPIFSAGQKVNTAGIVDAKNSDYVAGVNPVYTINNYAGSADTEYAIKFTYSNGEILQSQSNIPYVQSYAIKTPCAPLGDDVNEVTRLFIDAINADPKKQINVVAITNDAVTTATHGTTANFAAGAEITYADIIAIRDYNIANTASLSTGIKVTTIPAISSFDGLVSLQYSYPRETTAQIGLILGFDCAGDVTESTAPTISQGLAVDIKQAEYMANGWRGTPGPYRTFESIGVADPNAKYYAVVGTNYDCTTVEYNSKYVGVSTESSDPLATTIAMPTGGSTTYAQLIAILNPILALNGIAALS